MKLIIIGAGGYGQTVADIVSQSAEYEDIVFLDDKSEHEKCIGKCSEYEKYINDNTCFYPAFGNNTLRLEWINVLRAVNAKLLTFIHETAYVSPKASIGEGTIIMPKAVVNTSVSVENGCIINCGAIVDHNCVIGDGCHICLGVILKADNRIPTETKIEAGVVVENGCYC